MTARVFTTLLLTLLTCQHTMSQGTLLPPRVVGSKILATNRTVRIYLPPSYPTAPRRRYPVLYVHDGQNVFSTAGTNACFGWGGWDLDRTADRLIAEGRMREILIVAVDNSRSRYGEYRGLTQPGDSSASTNTAFDRYARFLVFELKPLIDRTFRTLKTPVSTAVMGSSLGGIASLSLAWSHPETIGNAASLSGSFQIEKKAFLENVLRPAPRRPGRIRVYLDSGVVDFTGDDDGRRNTVAVAAELRRLGWKDGKDLLHFVDEAPMNEAQLAASGLRCDKWEEAKHSQHNEFYWRQRAGRALAFLFPPK
jgi:predicted alpha/beta superfamily hydrolase